MLSDQIKGVANGAERVVRPEHGIVPSKHAQQRRPVLSEPGIELAVYCGCSRDVMAALDEALRLVDHHQRAYDSATESQRRLLNLAIFEHFTIFEEADSVLIEPQLEAFYDQLMDYADALPAHGAGPEAGQAPEPQAQPAALEAATGAGDRLGRDANPSPISWGRSSHSERLAEREGFEPSVDCEAHTRFPVVPVQPLRHLSRGAQATGPRAGRAQLRSARCRRAAGARGRRRPPAP
ncbi:MAG: hypothetical protein QOD83_2514 [Solirubrobacteraceae bacterium]|nr:hypothetical protein [Solirubrobacteraceae bacterium]